MMMDKVCNILPQGRVETEAGVQLHERNLWLCGSRSQVLVTCGCLLDLI